MNIENLVDGFFFIVLLWVSIDQTWTTLRRTSEWTLLGRGYLLFFAAHIVLWTFALISLVLPGDSPSWLRWAIRAEMIVAGGVLVIAMRVHPWPDPPDHIQWRALFGWPWFKKGEHRRDGPAAHHPRHHVGIDDGGCHDQQSPRA